MKILTTNKFFQLLFPMLLVLTACDVNTNDSHPYTQDKLTQPSEEEADGGISAGGGGTLPANPIPEYRVIEILGDAKRFLRLYLNYERRYKPSAIRDEKFFFQEQNLATQLEKTDIEILTDKPCLNKLGREVDASVYASRPNTICISVPRVSSKLIEENANNEIVALLAHELSHLLGASEKEAVELQKWVVLRTSSVSSKEAKNLENTMWFLGMDIESRFNKKNRVFEAIDAGNIAAVETELTELSELISTYTKSLSELPLDVIDFPIREFEDIVRSKIQLNLLFIRSMDTTNKDKDWFKHEYDICFSGKTEVSVSEISTDCDTSLKDNMYPQYAFKKINNITDLKAELKDVFRYTDDLGQRIRFIAHDQPLSFFNLPTNQFENPWGQFLGRYEATFESCTDRVGADQQISQNKLTWFQVYSDMVEGESQIFLKSGTASGWSSDPAYSGAYVYGGIAVVSGSENAAHLSSERGNRWYDRQGQGWSLTTKNIQRLDNGNLRLTLTSEYFRYDLRGVTQSEESCSYSLSRSI